MTQPETIADPRPVWDPDTALPAVRDMFSTAAEHLVSGDPALLPHLLSPLVETFQSQVERLQDQLEESRRRLAAAHPDGDCAALEAECTATDAKLTAFIQLANSAKDEYRHHTGHPWEPQPDESPAAAAPHPRAPDDNHVHADPDAEPDESPQDARDQIPFDA